MERAQRNRGLPRVAVLWEKIGVGWKSDDLFNERHMKSKTLSLFTRYRVTSYALSLFWTAVLIASFDCQRVAGQSAPFWFRTATGLSTMVSDDQLNRMGYDQFGVVGDAQIAYALLPWLDSYGGVAVSGFISSPEKAGGLLAPNAGLTFSTPQSGYRPYAQVDIGLGLTGALVRPLLRTGLGVDIFISKEIAFGPVLGYGQLFQPDGPNDSTDARYIWAGCALFYRYLKTEDTPIKSPPKVAATTPSRSAMSPEPVEPSPELLELIERTLPSQDSRVELLAPVLFTFDSDRLEPIGVAMLHEVGLLLDRRTDIELLEIRGYADNRGSTAYNLALSQKRAQKVYAWLVDHGVDPNRLRVAGQGATQFVETEETEKAHQQNRRVIFRVIRLRSR